MLEDVVEPTTHTLPLASAVMPCPTSSPEPPMKRQYPTVEPVGPSLTTNASLPVLLRPRHVTAPLLGKAFDAVEPVTYALPVRSTATPKAKSWSLPPSSVE